MYGVRFSGVVTSHDGTPASCVIPGCRAPIPYLDDSRRSGGATAPLPLHSTTVGDPVTRLRPTAALGVATRLLDDLIGLRAPQLKQYIYILCEGSHPVFPLTPQPPTVSFLTTLYIQQPLLYLITMSWDSNSFSPADTKETFNPADNFRGESRPEHHLHRDSEPLPRSDSVVHSQDQFNDPSMWENRRDIGTGIPTPFDTMSVLILDIAFSVRRYRDSPRDP